MAKRRHPKPPGVEFDQEYELVEVDRLKEHPQNPRRGVEDAIDESIEVNGWYGAVTAQKSTGYILAGNHRYRVAVRRGAEMVPTIWRDVDDETALRILLADNRTADLGEYDEELLTELLEGLETLDGTGYGLAAVEAAEEAEKAERGPGEVPADEVPDDKYEPQYGVMVVCLDEADQERIYEKLSLEGYKLRVVAV